MAIELELHELYRAYRKAKYESFRDKSHFSALAFAEYERSLDKNLRSLRNRLSASAGKWWKQVSSIGGYLYCPKSINLATNSEPHWATLDPLVDWRRRCEAKLADAAFRLVITPTIDFQVISALWIMGVGAKFDEALNQDVSYGARLSRRWHQEDELEKGFNEDSLRIFVPYFSSYRQWRENGLTAMRNSLERGEKIVAVTMDIRRFYHNIDPGFLLSPLFSRAMGVSLSKSELQITRTLVESISEWYRSTPDFSLRPEGALPVGLSASRVISNILMKEFDDRIASSVKPIYYGRYVDDIFLVVNDPCDINDSASFSRWLSSALGNISSIDEKKGVISIKLSYSSNCCIEFVQDKQRIFRLEGEYGIDLLSQIEDQIRTTSSEHRLLPELEVDEGRFIAKALLASGDSNIAVDALRKADSISLRRMEFALLLRDIESYEQDLAPGEWRGQREKFFDVVYRHVVTPKGFFEYSSYLYRAIGIGVACGDFDQVNRLLKRFEEACKCIRETSTAGSRNRSEFETCLKYYAIGFLQVVLQAATVKHALPIPRLAKIVSRIGKLSIGQVSVPNRSELPALVMRILRADLGRRPYKDYWYYDNEKISYQPSFTKHIDVLKTLRLGAIRSLRKEARRRRPYWPALAFPTRPLSIAELYLLAPGLLEKPSLATSIVLAIRGARLPAQTIAPPSLCGHLLAVPGRKTDIVKIAITSHLVTNLQWEKAAKGDGDEGLERYMQIRRIVRQAMADPARPSYIVFPECSIPARWAFRIAAALGRHGISFICGMENWLSGGIVRNDALISMSSNWAGYNCAVMFQQPKFFPAKREAEELAKIGRELYLPSKKEEGLKIYSNGGFRFGVLICSDLTNIENRAFYRGRIDALFVLEWNMDIETFAGLVESSSYDMCSYVIQINNREYGDSRVRAPYSDRHRRDVVRVKGGETDYYVIANLHIDALRKFKAGVPMHAHPNFKPLPIGYVERSK